MDTVIYRIRVEPSRIRVVGSSGLTVEALAKHDAKEGDAEDVGMLDTQSVGRGTAGGHTMSTWASNWTECTNATFGRVHRFWSSSSALHKEVNKWVHTRDGVIVLVYSYSSLSTRTRVRRKVIVLEYITKVIVLTITSHDYMFFI